MESPPTLISDAGQLIQNTETVISDLMNASGSSEHIEDKLKSAQKLMDKLSEMRASLGTLVAEASSALGVTVEQE